jgi:hypothetical protein
MAVLVEMHHTGDPQLRAEVVATIEHVPADRPRDWRVSIIGSQANDRWEMTVGARLDGNQARMGDAITRLGAELPNAESIERVKLIEALAREGQGTIPIAFLLSVWAL